MNKVYAFDFDGTLTTRDTFLAFIRYACDTRALFFGILCCMPWLILMKLQLYSNGKTKERLFARYFRDMPFDQFEVLCRRFAADNRHLLRSSVVSILRQAQSEGAKVVIVSASIDNWVQPFFPEVTTLGTQVEVSDGRLTGRFSTPNCYGPEKVKRLEALLPRRSDYFLKAYGDSRGDRELLAFADEGHRVQDLLQKVVLVLLLLVVGTPAMATDLVWFDGQHPVSYTLPRKVAPVVQTALDMFADDMRQVTGFTPVKSKKGTIRIVQGKSDGDGFRIYVDGSQLVAEGDGPRGTAFAILELSRMAGVSPWIWWGDCVPQHRQQLVVDCEFHTDQSPSVKYRGIFINDEDWTTRQWSSAHFEPGTEGRIGRATYKKIFQLLLRLRANTVWPAMHEGTIAFFKVPGAKETADSCGIIIGTSHCEPLLRNNVGEWDASQWGAFDYRHNRDAVQQYWTERLKAVSHSKDNMFTIGMRGIHDSQMVGYHGEDEQFEGLQQVIDDQQQLLKKYVGEPSTLPQVFVPYKEVLQLYEKGLRVPDYATLLWCDDNYGYLTRLSTPQEQQRQGGAGIYYHLSYWGRPHDYLWLTTTQPGLIYHELRQAYDHHMRRLWIANVHDPKVAGYDLELFLDMAWDINCVSASTLNDHYRHWLCRQFGSSVGERLFPLMHTFFRLCGQRKPEFMGWSQVEVDKRLYDRGLSQVRNTEFSPTAFGNELDRYLQTFRYLGEAVAEIGRSVDPSLSDAYFAAIHYPVAAAAAHAEKILEAQRARMMARGNTLGKQPLEQDSLLTAVANSQAAYQHICQLTDYYNHQMADGKWKFSMKMNPRDLPVFWAPLIPFQLSASEVANHQSHQHYLPGESVTSATDNHQASSSYPIVLEGVIARNASEWQQATEGAQPVQMLGHSMSAVSLPPGGRLSYWFDIPSDGDYRLLTALIPTQPVDGDDLRYSVSIDGGSPIVYSLKEPFRSERWKLNVLRGQALRDSMVRLTKGKHQLTIEAIDEHIIVDQWMIDSQPHRQFYLIPTE